MTDDIVTRLRESCAHLCAKCDRENAYGVAVEAADEIERLRGLLWDANCISGRLADDVDELKRKTND